MAISNKGSKSKIVSDEQDKEKCEGGTEFTWVNEYRSEYFDTVLRS